MRPLGASNGALQSREFEHLREWRRQLGQGPWQFPSSRSLLASSFRLLSVFSMTSAFKPGARSLWVHYKLVAGGGVLLFAATAVYGARAAYRSAFPSPPEQPAPRR